MQLLASATKLECFQGYKHQVSLLDVITWARGCHGLDALPSKEQAAGNFFRGPNYKQTMAQISTKSTGPHTTPEGLPRPMLALNFKDHESSLTWPVLVQPKLDGVRAVASKHRMMTRQGKDVQPGRGLRAVLSQLPDNVVLDGELYEHMAGFNSVLSKVRAGNWDTGLGFHAFDLVDAKQPFQQRYADLEALVASLTHHQQPGDTSGRHLSLVPTLPAANADEVELQMTQFIAAGYEGIMVRSAQGVYQMGTRCRELLKLKRFETHEFLVVAYKKDRRGLLVLECETENGARFGAVMAATHQERRELTSSAVVGRQATVKFQGYTEDAKPRFPIALALRDYE